MGWIRRIGLIGPVAYVLTLPALSLGRELAVLGIAWSLHAFASSGVWDRWVAALGLDPVYSGAAVRNLGEVQPDGLAVAGPLGALLHAVSPLLFAESARTSPGALLSAVMLPGGSLIGQAAASVGADVLVLSIGLALTWHSRRGWLFLLGALIQAQVVVAYIFGAHLDTHQLAASGVPMALEVLSPGNGWWLTDQVGHLPAVEQAIVLNGALLVLAYALAFSLVGVAWLARAPFRRRTHATSARYPRRILLGGSVGLALATVCSPLGLATRSASNWQVPEPQFSDMLPATIVRGLPRTSGGAHLVTVSRAPAGGWQYAVDGQSEVIRGVGYNPQYAAYPLADRLRLYERDFSAIRGMGANTIEGWFEDQFDEVTLEAAAQNDLGVILPFDLNQDLDYSDPNLQDALLRRASDWVLRYRANPALRMWAPGNENLHRILYRKWVSQAEAPRAYARAHAFAAFLSRLVDRIHELDPDHPVLYRDAEDVYLPWLKPSFEAPDTPRPWLVYGANVYSLARLEQIIHGWPAPWVGGPLVISEFAPAGQGPESRGLGYQQDWQRIRARPGMVLGGIAYTWAENGPEDLDRVFGLVDPSGTASDTALAGLRSAYLNDALE